MIVCDKCHKIQVDKDGDLCHDCKEILRPKSVVEYLEDYLKDMEDDYRLYVEPTYLEGLRNHIARLKNMRKHANELQAILDKHGIKKK